MITETVESFQLLGQTLLENTDADLRKRFVSAYGADPEALWAEVLRQMRLRLRSIGLGQVADDDSAGSGGIDWAV